MTKVALLIPSMNRPDFLLRQFEFYELVDSPHPIYISDSSNEENAEKLKNGIKKFKKLHIVYQWAEPGKDNLYFLLPLIKEKYCMQVGDDDLTIPKTISECADFLEDHPDYGTCGGKQLNIRFRPEDFSKPHGIIAKLTLLFGRPIEDDDMLTRAQNFLSNTDNMPFLGFMVTRIEVEKSIREITKNFSLMGHMTEFLIIAVLIISGKSKTLDKLGYIMHVNGARYDFDRGIMDDFILSLYASERWKICEDGLSEVIRKKGISLEESLKNVKWIFILYLVHKFTLEAAGVPIIRKKPGVSNKNLLKEVRRLISGNYFMKNIYYKFKPPTKDVTRPESRYFNDFKIVKDFLEKNNA